MKKEINDLLTLSRHNKRLALNQHFTLVATYFDEIGLNINFSSAEPVKMELQLVYTQKGDKWLDRATTLKGRSYEELIEEIPDKMSEMLNDLAADLSKQFKNGYIIGKVRTDPIAEDEKFYLDKVFADDVELDLTDEQSRGRAENERKN